MGWIELKHLFFRARYSEDQTKDRPCLDVTVNMCFCQHKSVNPVQLPCQNRAIQHFQRSSQSSFSNTHLKVYENSSGKCTLPLDFAWMFWESEYSFLWFSIRCLDSKYLFNGFSNCLCQCALYSIFPLEAILTALDFSLVLGVVNDPTAR